MNISIVGYGRMGQMVEKAANQLNIPIVSKIDPSHPNATHKFFNKESMEQVDVCIAFSQPDAAYQNILDACKWKKPLVIATTGWLDKLDQAREVITKNNNAVIYSSNFSLGVNLFFALLQKASKLMNSFPIYDAFVHEFHHRHKKDSPSGTAKTIGNLLIDSMDNKNTIVTESLSNRSISNDELHISSTRGGEIPGTHSVFFDSEFDTIELTHRARNRMGFAHGAIHAAEWIQDKKGLFTEKDMIQYFLSKVDAEDS